MDTAPRPHPIELLKFYVESGADDAVGDQAWDRFQPKPPAANAAPPDPSHAPSPIPAGLIPASPVPAAHPAAAIPGTSAHVASGCATLAELKAAMEAFQGLPIKTTALTTVFGDGNPNARVMVVGEAPGHDEDRQGIPFVGKSGKLLDRMLGSIGLNRAESVYITNVLPWRPLENRKPAPDEVAVCLPFLMRHLELVGPEILILFGGAAAAAVFANASGISRLRGKWHDVSSPGLARPIPAIATFHPAYLLRTPEAKREVWADLLMVRKRLDGLS